MHVDSCSREDFIAHFEAPNVPCVIDGIVDKWPAATEWTLPKLFEKYRHRRFKCGEDDDGNQVKVKLKYFLRYLEHQKGGWRPGPLLSARSSSHSCPSVARCR